MLRCAALYAALAAAVLAGAGDWPNWRGPNHDGISAETGFEARWSAPPPQVWSRAIGSAFSGLTCVDGKVYTCGTAEGQQVAYCLDAETGAVIWQRGFEPEYKERQGGDGTRATPTVHDGRVYILGALGRVVCLDAASGAELWSRQFDARPQWGYAGSVLIEGDLAVVTAGGEEGALAGLDRKTGKTVWKAGASPVGYSTPYPFTFEGQRYIVGFLAKEAIIVEARTGRVVGTIPWKTDWDVNAATPIFHGGHLFLSSGYKTGSAVYRLRQAGDGLDAERVWGVSDVILGKFQSAVLHDGHLYVSDEKALKCVVFATGEQKWARRGIANGTVVLADGQLVVLTERGRLLIGKATPAGFEPTADVEVLDGRCWTVPTLYRGRLYVRNFERAACYRLKGG